MAFFILFYIGCITSRRGTKTNLLPKNGQRPETVAQTESISTAMKSDSNGWTQEQGVEEKEEDEEKIFLDQANIYRDHLNKARTSLEEEEEEAPLTHVKHAEGKDSTQLQDGQCQDCQEKVRVCLIFRDSQKKKALFLCKDCLQVRLLPMLSIPAEQVHRVAMASLHGEFCAVTTTKAVLSQLRAQQF